MDRAFFYSLVFSEAPRLVKVWEGVPDTTVATGIKVANRIAKTIPLPTGRYIMELANERELLDDFGRILEVLPRHMVKDLLRHLGRVTEERPLEDPIWEAQRRLILAQLPCGHQEIIDLVLQSQEWFGSPEVILSALSQLGRRAADEVPAPVKVKT